MGRRVAQVPENYTLANFRAWTDRSRANLGVDRLDLVQLHCPPTPVFSLRRGLRRARHAGRRGADRRLRGQRGDVRRGARGDRPAGRGHRADHPQRVPPQAARPGAARGGGGRGRHHRPGAAGLRAAVRPVHAGHRVRRRRPPDLQPARRGVRRRRDVLRGGLPDRRAGGRRVRRHRGGAGRLHRRPRPGRGDHRPGGAALGDPAAGRHHRHPRRPQPARRPGRTRPPRTLPPLSEHALGQIEDLYDKYLRAEIHPRW